MRLSAAPIPQVPAERRRAPLAGDRTVVATGMGR
jgi:hypothetical protein